jgi:hypothetical protein
VAVADIIRGTANRRRLWLSGKGIALLVSSVAVVAGDGLGLAAPCDQEIEFAGNPKFRERDIGDGCEALRRAIIEDGENPETPPAAEPVRDESAASGHLEPRVLAPAPSWPRALLWLTPNPSRRSKISTRRQPKRRRSLASGRARCPCAPSRRAMASRFTAGVFLQLDPSKPHYQASRRPTAFSAPCPSRAFNRLASETSEPPWLWQRHSTH